MLKSAHAPREQMGPKRLYRELWFERWPGYPSTPTAGSTVRVNAPEAALGKMWQRRAMTADTDSALSWQPGS
jgi:hypothetical protein